MNSFRIGISEIQINGIVYPVGPRGILIGYSIPVSSSDLSYFDVPVRKILSLKIHFDPPLCFSTGIEYDVVLKIAPAPGSISQEIRTYPKAIYEGDGIFKTGIEILSHGILGQWPETPIYKEEPLKQCKCCEVTNLENLMKKGEK